MFSLLRLIHIFLGLNTLAAGIAVCSRMIHGKPFVQWVRHFLRFSLASASVGLILSINHKSGMQLLAMITVYVSGLVVFFWRKYCTSDAFGPAIVLSTMALICMQTVIMSVHAAKFLQACSLLDGRTEHMPMIALDAGIVLLFAIFSTISLKKIHRHASVSVMHGVTQ